MPGTVKVWWHDGAVTDIRHHNLPVVNEPELSYQELSVGSTSVPTAAAPDLATIAVIETDIDVRYLVRRPNETAGADAQTSKPIRATGHGHDVIGVSTGYSISFIEAL